MDLDAAIERWTDWAILLVIALGAGMLLHLALWRAGLRWTWTILVLAVAPLVGLVHTGAGILVGIAGASALVSSRYWHERDLERGGMEAQRERERLGIGTALRAAFAGLRPNRGRVSGERLAIGRTRGGRVRTVPFGSGEGRRGLIVGAPGSGKTVTMSAIAGAYIDQGYPAVCVDPKGDDSLRDALAEAAEAGGRRFLEWSGQGPEIYNPLARGGATEIADKALAGEYWSEPHYLRQAQRYLGWAVRAMKAAGGGRRALPRWFGTSTPIP